MDAIPSLRTRLPIRRRRMRACRRCISRLAIVHCASVLRCDALILIGAPALLLYITTRHFYAYYRSICLSIYLSNIGILFSPHSAPVVRKMHDTDVRCLELMMIRYAISAPFGGVQSGPVCSVCNQSPPISRVGAAGKCPISLPGLDRNERFSHPSSLQQHGTAMALSGSRSPLSLKYLGCGADGGGCGRKEVWFEIVWDEVVWHYIHSFLIGMD